MTLQKWLLLLQEPFLSLLYLFTDPICHMDPFPAEKSGNTPYRFNHIICPEAQHHQPGRPMEDQTAYGSQRNGNQPHEQDICLHKEFRIASAPEHPLVITDWIAWKNTITTYAFII